MPRLPTISGDVDNWGTILNDFLSQAHNPDGSLKSFSAGAIPESAIANLIADLTGLVHLAGTETITGAKTFSAAAGVTISGAGGLTITAGSFDVTGVSFYLRSAAVDTSLWINNSSAAGRNWLFGSGGTGSGFPGTVYLWDGTRGGLVWKADSTGLMTFLQGIVVSSGGLDVIGGGRLRSLGAFVAADKYVVADANGNLHLSALGPAS